MKWNRSTTIGMALTGCTGCNGMGMKESDDVTIDAVACACVYRAVFRACYSRFKDCVATTGHAGTVKLEFTGGRAENKQVYGNKNQEYVADFFLVSKRSLTEAEWQLFNWHFLLGADWKLCTNRLGISRGDFFHRVYEIQVKLGRVYADLVPYALYPLDEYFGQVIYKGRAPVTEIPRRQSAALHPPLHAA